eukprot:scaffold46884_cov63-Phaeocystis_antarctica.AAC.3
MLSRVTLCEISLRAAAPSPTLSAAAAPPPSVSNVHKDALRQEVGAAGQLTEQRLRVKQELDAPADDHCRVPQRRAGLGETAGHKGLVKRVLRVHCAFAYVLRAQLLAGGDGGGNLWLGRLEGGGVGRRYEQREVDLAGGRPAGEQPAVRQVARVPQPVVQVQRLAAPATQLGERGAHAREAGA